MSGVFFGVVMKKQKVSADHPLVQELIDKKVCVSKAEARRLVFGMPEDKIKERYLNRRVVVRKIFK